MSTLINQLSKPLLSSALIVTLCGCITVNAKSLDYQETKTLSVPMGNATSFHIDAAAGFLKIIGNDSLSDIKVTAEIYADDDNIKLILKPSGDKIVLEADANAFRGSNFSWVGESPRIDLTVEVPSKMKLDIRDGSGHISITSINNNININDGSGSMAISNIKGNMNIDDGSGSLEIENVEGNIMIDDGSGSLDIKHVSGTLEIEDGSGGLDVYDVGGLVTIDDGSGSINVKKLKSGLTIIEEGSGGLKMSDIEGPVSIK